MSQPQISESQKKKSKDEKSSSSNRATDLNNDTDTYCGKARHQMDDIERETDEGLREFCSFSLLTEKAKNDSFSFPFRRHSFGRQPTEIVGFTNERRTNETRPVDRSSWKQSRRFESRRQSSK